MRRKDMKAAHGVGGRGARRGVIACILMLLTLAACDPSDLLQTEDPVQIGPLTAPVPVLVAGAVGDFQVAYSGAGGDAFLSNVSNFTDEFQNTGTFPTRTNTDRRAQFPFGQDNTSDGAYNNLHRARRAAIVAIEAVQEDSGADDPRISLLRSLEAYTYVALGEGFCSGIPFSQVEDGVRIDGAPLPTQQVFEEAIIRFDQALAVDGQSNLARIGKARALLNIGRFDEAAAQVAQVPTSFIHNVEHSPNSARQNNPIFNLMANGRYSVTNRIGENGLPFRENDPRVPWLEDPGGGFDAQFRLFINLRYARLDSPVPLADGIEARLIEAEALLNAGNPGWLDILNDLRANVGSLMSARVANYDDMVGVDGDGEPKRFPTTSDGVLVPVGVTATTLDPLEDPGSPEARVDLLFQERAFWLYNTGKRLGDLRRLIRQYNRVESDVFPTGPYFKGGNYGSDVTFPIPFREANNPLFSGADCNVRGA